MRNFILSSIVVILFTGCENNSVPKPKAYLRLDYPKPEYKVVRSQLPFIFDKNQLAMPIDSIKVSRTSRGIDIKYPSLKATIYLTYKKVSNTNLDSLLRDAQTLTQKHTIKADEISSTLYENTQQNVYGMIYEVGGDAASQSQFYVTDSTKHFLSGSLYFYAKPNYDSIYPAAEYLKRDIKHLMESIKWQN